MSRGAASRRRGDREPTWDEESPGVAVLVEDAERRAGRLDAENTRLREGLAEVEAWYRLLQADHQTLQARHAQVGRKAARAHAESDRPGPEGSGFGAPAGRPIAPGREAGPGKDDTTMNRIKAALRAAARHKWASAALVAVATLVARDPGVQGLFSRALDRLGEVARGGEAREAEPSGFVLYAAMSQAREDSEKARLDYNGREATLKGDALLEAQDRLRATKARHRQARQAFLPELVRRCQEAKLPVPKEAMEEFNALRDDGK